MRERIATWPTVAVVLLICCAAAVGTAAAYTVRDEAERQREWLAKQNFKNIAEDAYAGSV